MSNNPMVSVIVPTFNRPEFLRRALNSIFEQTHRNYEAVVINDGGEDVASIAAEFPKTTYISLDKNRGLPAARNVGLRRAKGTWIAYLDDDDWFYPHHLQILVSWIHKARFVYSDAHLMNYRGEKKLFMSVDPDPGNILSHNITPVCCILHDHLLAAEAGMFDEDLPNHEDWDLWIRMSKIAGMYHVKEITCCVDRSHPTMQSDMDAMLRGMLEVKWRYRPRPEIIHYESSVVLPAEPEATESVRPDAAKHTDAGVELPAGDSVRKARQPKPKRAARIRQPDREAQQGEADDA